MAIKADYSRPKTFDNGVMGLALTEVTVTPESADRNAQFVTKETISPASMILPNGYPDYLRLILTSRVYEVMAESPLTHATNLSNRFMCNVLLKREDQQPIFSSNMRGVYNRMAHIDPGDRWRGVVACSISNHAQSVALAARCLKIPAVVVMPLGTPEIKQTNVSRFSCSVVLHGADFSGAEQEAARLETLHGLVPISPFDPYVIAGQGTIGMELLRQSDPQSLTAVFCYFDVTSLHVIAGIGVYLKRVAPHVKIIGVEDCVGVEKKNAHTMVASLNANERVVLGEVGLFAGGSISRAGGETLRICREVVDEVIQVTNEEMCAAVKDMFEDTRSILDPAGAFALAGLTKWIRYNPSSNHERSLVAITSGADIEFSHLHFAAEPAVVA